MKLATIPAIVAFGIASFCAYALYTFSPLSDVKLALSLIAGLVLFITLLFTVAVQTNYERTTMNVRFLSGVFFCWTIGIKRCILLPVSTPCPIHHRQWNYRFVISFNSKRNRESKAIKQVKTQKKTKGFCIF